MLTIAEKVEIVRLVGDNFRTAREAATEFNNRHPDRPPIDHVKVWRINNLFNRTGKVCNKQDRRARDHVGDAEILRFVRENPRCSLRRMSILLNVPKDTIWRCFRRNKLRPFKPVFLHTLEDGDEERRLEYCFWCQGEFLNNPNIFKNILFSDQATFTTNGTVNSQNTRNWSVENPHWVINCRRQYSEKVNVWCGILNERIIGPYFFDGNLNAERFINFLQNEFSNEIENLPLIAYNNIIFQLDGAPIHNALVVRNWLNENFPRRWIGRNSPLINCPPRSPDLTPLDYFLWGFLKNEVYKTQPRNSLELKNQIRQACAEITPATLRKVMANNRKRIEACIRADGGLIEHNI